MLNFKFSRQLQAQGFILILCWLGATVSRAQDGYDEIYTTDGNLRPTYQRFNQRLGIQSHVFTQDLVRTLMRGNPLGDRIRILPLPLILDKREYTEIVQAGTRQRFHALGVFVHRFLKGDYSLVNRLSRRLVRRTGEKEEYGFQPLKATLEEMLRQEKYRVMGVEFMRTFYKDYPPENIHFIAGSDFIRDGSGNFRVMEDNVGRVGGLGDVDAVNDAYLSVVHKPTKTELDQTVFAKMIRAFLDYHDLKPHDKGLIAIVERPSTTPHGPGSSQKDLETYRDIKILESLGFVIIDPTQETPIRELLRGEHASPEVPKLADVKAVVNYHDPDYASELFGLYRILFSRMKIPFFLAPGFELIGNKFLTMFADDIIEIVTGEKPILKGIRTRLHARLFSKVKSDSQHDPNLPNGSLFDQLDRTMVIKNASGSRGRNVHVLADLSDEAIKELERLLVQDFFFSELNYPHGYRFIAQDYVHPSQLRTPGDEEHFRLSYSVDVRPHSFALGINDIWVSDQPWARAVSNLDSPKSNVSLGGLEVPVFLEEVTEDNDCKARFDKHTGRP